MNLRELAEADLGRIQEDSATGFGWPVTVTDPSGTVAELTGFSMDIGQMIDPETAAAVSGRTAGVSLRIAHLAAAGLGIPKGISDPTSKPWVVQFNDINGNPYSFKVTESMPDRTIGNVICTLEVYE